MGLVKIGLRISGDSPDVDGLERDESEAPGDESDDSELAEVGCELGMVGDLLCSIPYELYDLPDLKEILSLETWNSCLTEEERFSLSAYLPDMDQQTFWLTMKELLGGNEMFFGSPLVELFERLKGGFCPPKVTRFREGLQFLQKRAYRHLLRSYHESMVQMFSDMKRVWGQCRPSIGIEERVHIWKARKSHKGMDPLDLNAYPMDEDLLGKEVNTKANMFPLSKKTKYMDSEGANIHIVPPTVASGMKLVAPNTSAKGVLKIKPAGINSFQTHIPKAMPSDAWGPCRPTPKGVLKIVPKGSSSRQQQPRAMPVRPEPTPLIEAPVLQTSRFSPVPPSMYKLDDYGKESPLLYHTVGSRKAYRSPELLNCIMDQQKVEFISTTGPTKNFQRSVRKVKRAEEPSLNSVTDLQEHNLFEGNPGKWNKDENGPIGGNGFSLKVRRYACDRENLWQNLGRENGEPSQSSLEPYPFAADYYQGERHLAPKQEKHIATYPRISEVVSRISDVGTGEHEMFTASSDRMKRHRDVNVGGSQKLYDQPAVSDGLRNGLVLPVTYKRRKAQAKHNPLAFVNPLTVETDFKSRMPKETNHLEESGKGIKIKFKNWKDKSLQK